MQRRGNEYDVSCRVNTTDPLVVKAEVDRIFRELYPEDSARQIDQAFLDITELYRGAYPGFHACDTPYHDVQHVMDVTLAMARCYSAPAWLCCERWPGRAKFETS